MLAKWTSIQDEYQCEITKYLQTLLIIKELCKYFSTYITPFRDNTCVIRYPGATRGYIEVDADCKIIDIKIYRDHPAIIIYQENAEQLLKDKFIGQELKFDLSNTIPREET